MRLTLDSTERHALIQGVVCRVWIGQTRGGAQVVAYIPRLSIAGDVAGELELARELRNLEEINGRMESTTLKSKG